jgi:hypothetical protein
MPGIEPRPKQLREEGDAEVVTDPRALIHESGRGQATELIEETAGEIAEQGRIAVGGRHLLEEKSRGREVVHGDGYLSVDIG